MKKALIIIDMQLDFINGPLGSPQAQAIVPIVKSLIEKQDYDCLIFTRDTHFDDYINTQEGKLLPIPHCLFETDGWQIHPDLNTENASILNKYSFGYDSWNDMFNDYDEITLVGLCTDICVISNAIILKAKYPETKINIIKDATAGVTEERKQAALTIASACQINII